jgi:hypothetical protein
MDVKDLIGGYSALQWVFMSVSGLVIYVSSAKVALPASSSRGSASQRLTLTQGLARRYLSPHTSSSCKVSWIISQQDLRVVHRPSSKKWRATHRKLEGAREIRFVTSSQPKHAPDLEQAQLSALDQTLSPLTRLAH